jgi:hypothetical protein
MKGRSNIQLHPLTELFTIKILVYISVRIYQWRQLRPCYQWRSHNTKTGEVINKLGHLGLISNLVHQVGDQTKFILRCTVNQPSRFAMLKLGHMHKH